MSRQSSQWRFVAVGLLLVAAIVVATGVIVEAQRSAAIEAYRIATNNLGVGMARQTARSLGAIDASLRSVRDLVAASAATPDQVTAGMQGSAAAAALTANCNRLSGIYALALIDQHRKVAASCGEWPSSDAGLGDPQLFDFLAVNDSATASVGRPVEIGTGEEWTATMALRINSADRRFAGLVIAVLSLRELEDFYKVAMPPNRSVSVARTDGVVLVRYPAGASAAGTTVPNMKEWSAGVASGGGQLRLPGRPGKRAGDRVRQPPARPAIRRGGDGP